MEQLAKEISKILELEAQAGRKPGGSRSLADSVKEFISAGEVDRSPRTTKDRHDQLKFLLEFCRPGLKIRDLTPDLLRQYREWQATRRNRRASGKLAPAAINANLRVVRAFLGFGHKRDWFGSPREKLYQACELVPQTHPVISYIPRADAQRLLLGALDMDSSGVGRFVAIGLCCPMRSGEIFASRWDDLLLEDDQDEEPRILIPDSKTHRARKVPLRHVPELRGYLSRERHFAKGEWICWSTRRSERLHSVGCWSSLLSKCGLHGLKPKDLRSNACSRMASWRRNGASVFNAHDLARAAGHSVTIAAKHYVELLRSQEAKTFEEELGIGGVLNGFRA